MSSEIPMDRDLALTQAVVELRALQSAGDSSEQVASKVFRLNRTDAQALDVIHRTGGISPSELARAIGFTTGGMTTVIDRLERAGYAYRSADVRDRRKVVVQATALTRDRSENTFSPLWEALREVAGSYSDHELALILEFLRKSRQALVDFVSSTGAG